LSRWKLALDGGRRLDHRVEHDRDPARLAAAGGQVVSPEKHLPARALKVSMPLAPPCMVEADLPLALLVQLGGGGRHHAAAGARGHGAQLVADGAVLVVEDGRSSRACPSLGLVSGSALLMSVWAGAVVVVVAPGLVVVVVAGGAVVVVACGAAAAGGLALAAAIAVAAAGAERSLGGGAALGRGRGWCPGLGRGWWSTWSLLAALAGGERRQDRPEAQLGGLATSLMARFLVLDAGQLDQDVAALPHDLGLGHTEGVDAPGG